MNKAQKIINGVRYNLEVWMMNPINGVYRFGAQVFTSNKIQSFSMRLIEEFIEDEIDNDKRKTYLEQVALCVVKNHIIDFLTSNKHAIITNLGYWFKEAKRQIDKETKE
ncbi:MAG: hypothetical protein UR56_C0003G0057 [Candidatus Roizmanbacteria bacterium GW2011_GWC2_34_23]|uniref:Uncharacterized protein n=1 Tax=Candidatus Roizmanbacteria bacterium GW2011_GWC2_34_23 TaxID=1618484 RepID=A0A0G0DII3_9BACT|nr:MAG: hypothetical protein UR15_C0032G0009 [Parcubacteria group bacterium GW2011_GWA2_31_28]KKP62950.1 MAG: hypothetical protein UR56_C0003G0057 [Candidatus Roizmanbacteria bacterium GW2011_GWC2_34_23]